MHYSKSYDLYLCKIINDIIMYFQNLEEDSPVFKKRELSAPTDSVRSALMKDHLNSKKFEAQV